ncbi:hypothetical protein ABGB16_20285 [Micromonospora sp. B11E3]|uniref:hypothetical protein n=1 Tax=Micromonospora sp. B11E3 TaxID=3153562 RepID=UPI00325D28F4
MPPQPHRPGALEWQVFRGSEAVRRGLLTRHQLRGASWLRVRHDVYADVRLHRDHGLACRAAMLRLPPDALLAGPSAAWLHGIEHAASFADDVHVLIPRSARVDSQPGIRVHTLGADLPIPATLGAGAATIGADAATIGADAATIGADAGGLSAQPGRASVYPGTPGARAISLATGCGPAGLRVPGPAADPGAASLGRAGHDAGRLPRSQPAQAAWETAVWLEPVRAVAIVDSLLGRGLTTRAALAAVAGHNADRPGGRRAQWVFGLADGGAQSPPESHLRVRLVLAGLPRPVTQHPVRLASGLVLHPDLAWPGFRVAVEYDGHWHADADQLHRDRQRLNHLVGAGWVVLHATSRRLHQDFPALVREVRAALVARGWRR